MLRRWPAAPSRARRRRARTERGSRCRAAHRGLTRAASNPSVVSVGGIPMSVTRISGFVSRTSARAASRQPGRRPGTPSRQAGWPAPRGVERRVRPQPLALEQLSSRHFAPGRACAQRDDPRHLAGYRHVVPSQSVAALGFPQLLPELRRGSRTIVGTDATACR
jgi:hypothetical protein